MEAPDHELPDPGGSVCEPSADADADTHAEEDDAVTRLRRASVVAPTRHDRPIDLVAPDSSWPQQFAAVRSRILFALGERARAVEHVGSTSVPGLVAKPVIDVVLVVEDSADEAAYVPALESVGFELRIREPEWHEHRVVCGEAPRSNVHVFSIGSTEVARMLRFRDHLRANPDDRDRYAAVKKELAGDTWAYVQQYADAKTAVIEEILERARTEP